MNIFETLKEQRMIRIVEVSKIEDLSKVYKALAEGRNTLIKMNTDDTELKSIIVEQLNDIATYGHNILEKASEDIYMIDPSYSQTTFRGWLGVNFEDTALFRTKEAADNGFVLGEEKLHEILQPFNGKNVEINIKVIG